MLVNKLNDTIEAPGQAIKSQVKSRSSQPGQVNPVKSNAIKAYEFLNYIYTRVPFLLLSIALRMIQGATYFGVMTSSTTLTTHLYPEDVSKALGVVEIADGIGFSMGPLIGGFLYQRGGFMLPFFVLSGLCFITFVISSFSTPKITYQSGHIEEQNKDYTFRDLIVIPQMYVVVFDLMIYTMSSTFFDVTYAPYLLNVYGLTELQIGLVFTAMNLVYGVSGPIVGSLVDCTYTWIYDKKSLVFSNLWLTIASSTIIGMGCSMMYIPSMELFLDITRENGFKDGIQMKGTLSAIMTVSEAIGGLLGPILSGALVEYYDFRKACGVFALLNFLTIWRSSLTSWLDAEEITESGWLADGETYWVDDIFPLEIEEILCDQAYNADDDFDEEDEQSSCDDDN
ncbi:MFS-type transporter SLC18B1 [Nymphon striatum]|nr:MFS-type transporter SLC18B1 [Nymphon striatum]